MGVATQNPKLREKFTGSPEHIVNYFNFISQEVRHILAALGYKKLDDLIAATQD